MGELCHWSGAAVAQPVPRTHVRARLHRRAVTASGSGERWCRSVFCVYTGVVNRVVSMQMTFPKYTRNSPKPLGMYANDPQNNGTGPMASETRRRGSLTSNLGEKTASRAKEIGQYAQSQSGILEKSLRFLNRAVYRSTARSVPSQCKCPHRKLHVLFF